MDLKHVELNILYIFSWTISHNDITSVLSYLIVRVYSVYFIFNLHLNNNESLHELNSQYLLSYVFHCRLATWSMAFVLRSYVLKTMYIMRWDLFWKIVSRIIIYLLFFGRFFFAIIFLVWELTDRLSFKQHFKPTF